MVDNEKQKAIGAWLGNGSINIFGLPFSGKDTQAHRLAAVFGGEVLGGGDIIRGSKHKEMIEHISLGKLTPTDEYLALVLPFFKREEFANKPLILSSVGRWHGEEEGVLQATAQSGHGVKAVVFLHVPEEIIHARFHDEEARLQRGQREDDDLKVLEVRLQEFREKTQPVLDYYKDKGLLIQVDGNQPPDKVTTDIIDALYDRSQT